MPELHPNKLYRSSEETDHPEIAHINGAKLPSWLDKGTFLRIGPAKFDFPSNVTFNHFLDGFSILSKFVIEGDSIHFEKKYLQSDAYRRALAAQKPVITEFGTKAFKDPNKSLFSRMISAVLPIELSDNCQMLFPFGKDVFATSDSAYFRPICPETLGTGEKYDCNKLFGVNIITSSPQTDSEGFTYNIGCSVLSGLKANVIRIPPVASNCSPKELMKKSKVICSIPSRWAGLMSYNHSFALTKDYIIYISQPYVMNIAKAAMTYLKGPPLKEWLEWRGGEYTNRFYVIEKATGKLIKTEFLSESAFFFLNIINAFQDGDQIVIDINAYENADVFEDLYLDKLRSKSHRPELKSQARGTRFVIPVIDISNAPADVDLVQIKSEAMASRVGDAIILCPELLTEQNMEITVVNPKFRQKRYNFYYGCSINSIHKVPNVKTKEDQSWFDGKNFYPNSLAFVPNPQAKTEDDGVLIAAVTDLREDHNDFVLFLDGKSMQEIGRASFKSHIPQALSALFLTDS